VPYRVLLFAWVLLAFLGCREPGHVAAYRFSSDRAYTIHYQAVLTGKAEGFQGSRAYGAAARAGLHVNAVQDSVSGRSELTVTADSIAFTASDRDPEEGRYMQERLRRYKAKMVVSRTGQVLALEEEPDLPPVDFSPLNFSRLLAYGLPAFPREAVRAGSEWTAEQPLLDKFHPASKVVKRYKVKAIRETPDGRLLECDVWVDAWLEDGLASSAAPAAGDSGTADLSGRGEVVFNLDRGQPLISTLELEGRFQSPVHEGVNDSGRVLNKPVRLGLRLDLRFGG
jgi:hypothetical protein